MVRRPSFIGRCHAAGEKSCDMQVRNVRPVEVLEDWEAKQN